MKAYNKLSPSTRDYKIFLKFKKSTNNNSRNNNKLLCNNNIFLKSPKCSNIKYFNITDTINYNKKYTYYCVCDLISKYI